MHTHSQRLETWLGKECVENLSRSMVNWYGPPIAVHGVPGSVYAHKGGDFRGRIEAGSEVSAIERAETMLRKSGQARRVLRGLLRRQAGMAGFSSLSDMIAEATAGKRREFAFQKSGPTGVANATSSLFGLGSSPSAGAASSAAPGGIAPTDATAGGFPFDNVSPDTRHFVFGGVSSSVANNTLLLYDRLFGVAKTMNSTATEAVTGVPSRYTSQTATDPDYIGGNFLFIEIGATQLAATAHNWTVCTYTDQGGNASTLPSVTGLSAGIVRRLDMVTSGAWFATLEAGDVGIKALTQMQCSAAVATGLIDFVIGHPIAFFPCPLSQMICTVDGINTSFNLARVFDDACLAFLETNKPSTTATNYSGTFTLVHG